MNLVTLVKLLKTAPPTQIDPPIRELIEKVDLTNETAVRAMLLEVYQSGFHAQISSFVAAMVDPKFTKDYPLN